jgi:N-acetylmuramoyl-L-alanine amidase
MYGVTADTDWVTSETKSAGGKEDGNPVDHVSWRQASDDLYELIIHLRGHRQWGYKINYEGTTLCLGVKRQPQLVSNERPLAGLRICLDPGHGGSEIGSTGCSGLHESKLNLAIAEKLQPLLVAQGAHVTMTRTDDSVHSLEERVRIANEQRADILLSIHNNGLPDGSDPWKVHGTSTYWYHPQSIELARSLRDSLVETLGFSDLGARYQNLALARPTAMPAVLVEVGFMVNPDEFARLIDPGFQEKVAQALCQGLVKYMHPNE